MKTQKLIEKRLVELRQLMFKQRRKSSSSLTAFVMDDTWVDSGSRSSEVHKGELAFTFSPKTNAAFFSK